jgi:bile acid:Na+ symporter, BASS family
MMDPVDQQHFNFDPRLGIALGIMVAIMVFSVALDLRWEQFRRLFRDPRAPIVGIIAQLVVLPAIAYLIARYMIDSPSVALGLLLVASCPGGAVSNYLTYLSKGDVATSVTITAVITVGCILSTPIMFASLAAANPTTMTLLNEIGIEPGRIAMMFVVTVALPIAGGMLLVSKRPERAARMRPWVRRIAMVLFILVVSIGTLINVGLMVDYASEALLPVTLSCFLALVVGWSLSRLAGLKAPDRRAVTIEAGGQQAGLAIGIAVAFFPSLTGVAVTAVTWGVVQIVLILPMVAVWSKMPPPD